MLSLVRNPEAEWRSFIDLEHDICYAPENHWNALTDGHYKCIFRALEGHEQFFDLRNDPHETEELAGAPAHAAECRQWRARLIEHLTPRGEPFVRNGDLALRPKIMLYSPNYPGCSCHKS
ncbi:MAG: arylsulfatase, partial [Candidatus Hydrogenedentes bacterium]|nr:arylsulfatase [Candidatus Hydrogenedentota bacterium]